MISERSRSDLGVISERSRSDLGAISGAIRFPSEGSPCVVNECRDRPRSNQRTKQSKAMCAPPAVSAPAMAAVAGARAPRTHRRPRSPGIGRGSDLTPPNWPRAHSPRRASTRCSGISGKTRHSCDAALARARTLLLLGPTAAHRAWTSPRAVPRPGASSQTPASPGKLRAPLRGLKGAPEVPFRGKADRPRDHSEITPRSPRDHPEIRRARRPRDCAAGGAPRAPGGGR